MELAEYIHKQNENYKLWSENRRENGDLLDEMIQLEQTFFLEHLDLCKINLNEDKNLEISGPGGGYLFTMSSKDNDKSPLQRTLDSFAEKIGLSSTLLDKVNIDGKSTGLTSFSERCDMGEGIMEHVASLAHNKAESKPPPLVSPSDSQSYIKAEQDIVSLTSKKEKSQGKHMDNDNSNNYSPSEKSPK